jgi:tetratricopeptide (TPR) repeat protein
MELTVDQALQQGIAAHNAGNLQEAERLYRAILQSQPTHPDANHNLGILAVSSNKAEFALPLFKAALDVNPGMEQFWISYIDALTKEKQFKNAKRVIKKAKKAGFVGEKLNALEVQLTRTIQGQAKGQLVPVQAPSQAEIDSLLASYQSGQHEIARDLGLSITQKFPNHQLSWKVLGGVFAQAGQMDDALIANQNAVRLDPKDAEAHSNLGATLKYLGRLEHAEASYRQAIALKPDFAAAHYNLGNSLKDLGRLEEAEASYRQAIALKPDYAAAHYNLGIALQELGRLEEAEASYRQAIALKPDFAEVHYNLGNSLKDLGRLEEAEAGYRQAIELKPDYAEAYNNSGTILKELGRLEEAEASYRQAITIKPDYVDAHFNLGIILKELGRLEEAEASYRQAITIKPDYAEAYNNSGTILQELGRLEEAEASYRQAIALKPDFTEAHQQLSLIKNFTKEDEQFVQMQKLCLDQTLTDEQRCYLSFALGKASEDLNQIGRSFKYYSEGNAFRKKLLAYNIRQDIELFDQLKKSYPSIDKNSLKNCNLSNEPRPIFILGMPRSGTTLVEQIISSHSAVTGAGELPDVNRFGDPIARGMSKSDTEILINFRERYLKKLQKLSNGNPIVTDKMPLNFRYIGLICSAFPDAKIVHVTRNSAATCWGIYKQYFTTKSLGYCYDLDDLIAYYGLYQELMQFWGERYGDRIYNLNYETLTINQEDETRKLLQYLGIEWEEACLTPQDNKRSVATASNVQIRQKIYKGSSQKWQKFEPFLNGALSHLGD